mmetsp:Transcript_1867/g.4196  ORF Transcript_1867/g.4196 Transcript_1867/m.4196 type:complete len:248 (-) Transcript_1867:65-808(-)
MYQAHRWSIKPHLFRKTVTKAITTTLRLRVLLHCVVEGGVHTANTSKHVVVLIHSTDVDTLDDAQNMLKDLPLLGGNLFRGLLCTGRVIGEGGTELQVCPNMPHQHNGPGQCQELQGTLDDGLVILLDELGLAQPSISINHQESGQRHLVHHLGPIARLQSLHQRRHRVQLLANSVRPSRRGERSLKRNRLLVGSLERSILLHHLGQIPIEEPGEVLDSAPELVASLRLRQPSGHDSNIQSRASGHD